MAEFTDQGRASGYRSSYVSVPVRVSAELTGQKGQKMYYY